MTKTVAFPVLPGSVLPHSPGQRLAWLARPGFFHYDHLGKRQLLLGCRCPDLRSALEGRAIEPQCKRGFEYSDCRIGAPSGRPMACRDAGSQWFHVGIRAHPGERRRSLKSICKPEGCNGLVWCGVKDRQS
jgi:glycerol-3-phosphate dehydrogenase